MAGSVSVSSAKIGPIRRWTLDWLSDSSGDVDTDARAYGRGWIEQIKYEPDGGGTQPSNAYDLVMNDAGAEDVFTGTGANLSNSAGKYSVPMIGDGSTTDRQIFLDGETLDLVISNAGNAKGGIVYLFVREV
jgi:hypothetical protein